MPRYTRRTTPWPENRRKAICEWLRANGVDPNNVPQDADLYLEDAPEDAPYTGRYLHYEAFHLTADGHKHVDERGYEAAVERRTTPLLVDPPAWWQPYRKPTRDQLLDVLERVRALGPDLEMEATLPGMHDAAREAKRDASSRIRSIIDREVSL